MVATSDVVAGPHWDSFRFTVDVDKAQAQHSELAHTTKGVQEAFLPSVSAIQGIYNAVGFHPSNGTMVYRQAPPPEDGAPNCNQLFCFFQHNENEQYQGYYLASDLVIFDCPGKGPLAKAERRRQNEIQVFGFAPCTPNSGHTVPPGESWHVPSNNKWTLSCAYKCIKSNTKFLSKGKSK